MLPDRAVPSIPLAQLADKHIRQLGRSLIDFERDYRFRHFIALHILAQNLEFLDLGHRLFKVLQRNLDVQLIELRLYPPDIPRLAVDVDKSAHGVVRHALAHALQQLRLVAQARVAGEHMVVAVLGAVLFLDLGLLRLTQVVLGLAEGGQERDLVARVFLLGVERDRLGAGADDDALFGRAGDADVLQGEAALGDVFDGRAVAVALAGDIVAGFLLRGDQEVVVQQQQAYAAAGL